MGQPREPDHLLSGDAMEVNEENGKTYIDIQQDDMHKASKLSGAGKGDGRRPTDREKFDAEHVRIFGK